MEDKMLNDSRVFDLVRNENMAQLIKWKVQNRSQFEWLAYLVEEVGELSRNIQQEYYLECEADKVVEEAIQVATLSLKIVEMYLSLCDQRGIKLKLDSLGKGGKIEWELS